MLIKKIYLIILFVTLTSSSLFSFEYKVEIEGVQEKEIVTSLKESSQTVQLKNKKSATTFQALRKRADSDLKKMNDVCHYYGFLSSEIDFTIIRTDTPTVVFKIALGPRYTIKKIRFLPASFENAEEIHHLPPPFDTLNREAGSYMGQTARTEDLLRAEESALLNLKKLGYAFCKVTKKEAYADVSDNTVQLSLFIDIGPEVHFGKTTVYGNETVKSGRIDKHIDWKQGDLYTPAKIERTYTQLEKSGLFTSVRINENVEQFTGGELPIEIMLEEAKHRSFAAGISYTTSKGPGIAGEWDHRNLHGYGDKLSFQTELWKKFQWAALSLREPHYGRYDQTRVWQIELDRQHPIAYFSSAISGSCTMERHLDPKTDASWGIKLESLHSKSDDDTGTFYLAKLPLFIRWNNSNNLLDPLRGYIIQTKLTPSYQFLSPHFVYLNHTTTGMYYKSFFTEKMTLAGKLTLGNIFGAAQHTIPTPDRFFSGTENTLRGYRYLTVSPLNKNDKPIGGRSLLAASIEARFRTDSGLGWALFYDIGKVYSANFPVIDHGFLQSTGVGVRYATPLGPLRLDVAIPLNRRHKIDPHFQVYFSIGQSF